MEGLLSFLLFAGLFFLMMRFGCGAHMMHGHRHEKHSGGDKKHIDPVCGIEVDAQHGYGLMHDGVLYRFCSKKCLEKFEEQPGSYIRPHKHHAGGVS